jgi:TetR/AcrR family transcriptional regulator
MPQAAGATLADARRRRRGADTAERILDAAEALFAERGYAATTLRDVAAVVGVRNPSLYNHFSSKEALYAAVLERGIRPVFEALAGWVERAEHADQGAIALEMTRLLAERPALAKLIQHEVLGGAEHVTPMLREWLGPVLGQARRMVEMGPPGRRWRPEHLPNLILAMYQIIVGYFTVGPLLQELTGRDPLSDEALAEHTRFLEELVPRLLGPDEEGEA